MERSCDADQPSPVTVCKASDHSFPILLVLLENIDDVCIHYEGGRVAANESLIAEISARGLRKTTKETGLDRKTIRAILNGKKVKASTLAKVVIGRNRF